MAAEEVGLLFEIKASGTQAKAELKAVNDVAQTSARGIVNSYLGVAREAAASEAVQRQRSSSILKMFAAEEAAGIRRANFFSQVGIKESAQLVATAQLDKQRSAAKLKIFLAEEAAQSRFVKGLEGGVLKAASAGKKLSSETDELIAKSQAAIRAAQSVARAAENSAARTGAKMAVATKEATSLQGQVQSLTSSFSQAVIPVTAAIAAYTAIAGAAIAAGVGIFELTKRTAEYDGHLQDLSQKTGIGISTLSTLKIAAENSGASIETVNTSLGRYLKSISDADHGNKTLAAGFKQVGFTEDELRRAHQNNDVAIQLLVQRIGSYSNEQDRLNALQKLGVRNGQDLNGVINEMNGDLLKFQATMREMGLVITPEQAKQADKFNDTLHLLELQVKGLGFTIGREVMPAIQTGIDEVSRALSGNRGDWESWGKAVRGVADTVIRVMAEMAAAIREAAKPQFSPFKQITGPFRAFDAARNAGIAVDREQRNRDRFSAIAGFTGGLSGVLKDFGGKSGGPELGDKVSTGGGGKSEGQKDAETRLKLLEIEARRHEAILKFNLDGERILFDEKKRSLDEYTKAVIAAEKETLDAKLKVIEEERAQAERLPKREREVKLAEIDLKELEARNQFFQKENEVNANQRRVEQEAENQHRQALLEIQNTYDQKRLAQLQDFAEKDIISYQRAEMDRREIEEASFKRQEEELAQQFILAGKSVEERRKVADALSKLYAEEANAAAEAQRRKEEAINRDIERTLQYRAFLDGAHRQIRELNRQIFDINLSTARPFELRSREVISAQADLRRQEVQDQLDANIQELNLRQVHDLEIEKDENKRWQILKTYNALRAAERRRAIAENQQIDIEENDAQRGRGFFGGFDLGLQTGQIAQFEDGIHSLTDAFKVMGSVAGSAVNMLATALGGLVEQWVLTGKAGPDAMRKLTASVLASVAAQAAVKAIFELAEGFAAVARAIFGDPRGGPEATAHFTAAAIYGSLGAVAAVAGRAVAGNAFNNQGKSDLPGKNNDTGDREPIVQGRPRDVVVVQIKHEEGMFVSKVENAMSTSYNSAGKVYDIVTGR